MNKIFIFLVALLFATVLFNVYNKKFTTRYPEGQQFCVYNYNVIPPRKFEAIVFHSFKHDTEDGYIVGPKLEQGLVPPLQFLALIGNDGLEFWMENCK